jgi:hypothetical protein
MFTCPYCKKDFPNLDKLTRFGKERKSCSDPKCQWASRTKKPKVKEYVGIDCFDREDLEKVYPTFYGLVRILPERIERRCMRCQKVFRSHFGIRLCCTCQNINSNVGALANG